MAQITKDTIIADLLNMEDVGPQAVPLLQAVGMHCLGCAMASGETIGQACEAHGVDTDELLSKLTALVKQ